MRLEQGNFTKTTFYNYTIQELSTIFYEYGVKRMHIVDLDGSISGKMTNISSIMTIKQIAKCTLEIGGGIRSLKTVEEIWKKGLSAKEDKIMLGSLPLSNQQEFLAIVHKYRSSILVAIDVFNETVKIAGWKKSSSIELFSYIEEMCTMGIAEFLVTQIKNDGMLKGLDIKLYRKITKAFPSIRLIASGGLSSIEDLDKLKDLNIFGVILGKAFYESKISLDELKQKGFI